MNEDNGNDKTRQPDHYISIVQPGRNGKERIRDVGELWDGKDGYSSGESVFGRVIVQSRAKREELQRMRSEQGPSQEPAHSQEINPQQ